MQLHFVMLWTDALIFLLLLAGILTFLWMRKQEHWREPWRMVMRRKLAMSSLVVLTTFAIIAVLDSIHFTIDYVGHSQTGLHSRSILSVLDLILQPLGFQHEETYSSPFAIYSYSKKLIKQNGVEVYHFPRLKYGGRHVQDFEQRHSVLMTDLLISLVESIIVISIVTTLLLLLLVKRGATSFTSTAKKLWRGQTGIAWREMLLTVAIIVALLLLLKNLAVNFHVFGTDKIGNDVLYESIKSIRTGLVIGTVTTLVMLPFAIFLGMAAGYFGGWIDDIIQYTYTTLSSIPGVLLISAAVLSLQLFIDNHPNFFSTLETRADARLLALCIVLGITSWTSLCRLLRAETLKLREADFVRAAITMGVRNGKILLRHILPNVMHIILITLVLDFSGLVLAEAVLSYVGVGVDPTTFSWGNMINSARLDLSREPVVWWPLCAAFLFMFTLVLAANLFADAVRDAFDPRLRNVEA